MTRIPSRIDPDEVVWLYLEKGWSVRDIADYLGTAYGRIYGLLCNRVVMRTARDSCTGEDHVKVAETIRSRIIDGTWKPDRKILSIADIARIFDVRQQTVRLAIADMRQRGYLCTEPRRGTYVRPPECWPENQARDQAR